MSAFVAWRSDLHLKADVASRGPRSLMILKDTGAFFGECGFFSAPERPERFPRPALLPPYWGRGLAREAAAAVLDLGFGSFALRRILSVVEQRDGASRLIMEALGFRIDHDWVTAKGRTFSYALSAENWAAQTE